MRAVGIAASVVLAVSAVRADWPQLGGPDRNDIAPNAELAKTWPAEGPKVLWSMPMGMGFAGAAIRDGEVYVLDRVADQQDVLRCLDLKTGKELWTMAYDAPGKTGQYNGSRTVPAVTEKYVITGGPFGQLTCTDRRTHAQVWQAKFVEPGAKLPPWETAQSPLVVGSTVITSGVGPSGGLNAFDLDTGKVLWQSKAVPGTAYCSPSLVDVAGRKQITMVSGKGVSGIDPKDGSEIWNFPKYKCGIPIPNVVVVGNPADGKLLVTGGYKAGSVLIQLATADGKMTATEVWRIPQGSQIHWPIVIDDKIYLNGNTNETNDNFTCLDAATGKVLWQDKQYKLDRACILYAGGMFFMIDGTGMLHMATLGDGKLEDLGTAKLFAPKDIWAPIAVSDGVMVLRDQHEMKAIQVGQ